MRRLCLTFPGHLRHRLVVSNSSRKYKKKSVWDHPKYGGKYQADETYILLTILWSYSTIVSWPRNYQWVNGSWTFENYHSYKPSAPVVKYGQVTQGTPFSMWKSKGLPGLVNVYITNWKDPPCYSWVNPLFLWPFSIAIFVDQRVIF